MSIVLEGNGGSFPDGSGKLTLEPINGFVRLPDWSAVDRPGYTLTGWTASDGTSMSMGEKAADGTYTAVWTEDPVRYCTDFLPQCAVRIYRAVDEYIDVTERMSSLPVIEKAENRPGSATFSVVKGVDVRGVIDPAKNPLSPACTLWNKGEAGGVRPGMYVWFGDVGKDGRASYVFDGFITTVTGSDTDAEITVGDRIAFLGKSGTWLRRNYRKNDSTYTLTVKTGTDEEGKLYADLSKIPEGGVLSGNVEWVENQTSTEDSDGIVPAFAANESSSSTEKLMLTCTMAKFAEYVRSLTLRFQGGTLVFNHDTPITMRAEIESLGVVMGGNVNVTIGRTLANPKDFSITIDCLTNGIPMKLGDSVTIRVYVSKYDASKSRVIVSMLTVTSAEGDTIDYMGSTAKEGSRPAFGLSKDSLKKVTGTFSDGRFYPDVVPGNSSDWAMFRYTLGTIPTSKIMSDMCEALGILPIITTTSAAALNEYRTGGGYAQDYFQRLADIADANGRILAYSVRGYTVPVMVIGDRFLMDEGAQAAIAYGEDDVAGAIFFSSFAPKMTMKNRPNLVTLRGTMSNKQSQDSKTITVSVEDPVSTDDRFGIIVEQVLADTNINSIVDGVQSAYSELSSSELDEWEGSITLPEVRADFIRVSGQYAGSGVPVTIHDSRNGISDYPTLVRQQRTDYNACETILTVGNYSERYSNAIADGIDMAITAADASIGATDVTLYNAQYVRVKASEQTIKDTGNEVMVRLGSTGDKFAADSVKVFAMPRGGYIVVATIESTSENNTDTDYDIVAISLNGGNDIGIDVANRPDFFVGQVLTVSMVITK